MDIKLQIREFILANFLYTEDTAMLRDEESLVTQGIIDSLGAIELSSFLQAKFKILITEEEMIPENFDSVDKLVAFVVRKRTAMQ